MCNVSGALFGARRLERKDVAGKRVLEVGSLDVNGSLRPLLESWGPERYVGVDLTAGPGVDVVLGAEAVASHFGEGAFDVVVSTEMLEHVRDWRAVVTAMKRVLAPGGVLLVTTRSPGYPYHGWPGDFWRYTLEDMRAIFADFEALVVEADPMSPGVFVRAVKPLEWQEADLAAIALTSVISGARVGTIADAELKSLRFYRLAAKDRLKQTLVSLAKRYLGAAGKAP